jgi:hypothetical protein
MLGSRSQSTHDSGRGRLHRKHRFHQLLYCCLFIHCHRNMFTKLLPSSGRLSWLHYSGFQVSCHTILKELFPILNTLNLAIVHVLHDLPCQKTDSTIVVPLQTLKICDKTTRNIDIKLSLFHSPMIVVLWFYNRGLCIIAL